MSYSPRRASSGPRSDRPPPPPNMLTYLHDRMREIRTFPPGRRLPATDAEALTDLLMHAVVALNPHAHISNLERAVSLAEDFSRFHWESPRTTDAIRRAAVLLGDTLAVTTIKLESYRQALRDAEDPDE